MTRCLVGSMHEDFDADFDEPIDWKFKDARFDMSGFDLIEPMFATFEAHIVLPARKFMVNMIRVRALHDAIADISGQAMWYQEAVTHLNCTIGSELTKSQFNAAVETEVKKRLEAAKADEKTATAETALQQSVVYHILDSWHSIHINMGMRAIMQTFISGLWATTEVLFSELLVSAYNAFPTLFNEDYANFSVQRLESFRTTYKRAFNSTQISTIIGDQCVDALFLVRNVFAHELGVVDDFARGRFSEKNLTKWAALPSGKQFPITGSIVKDYAERNIRQGVALIVALDEWIKINKPK